MTFPSNKNPITGDKLQTKPSTKEYRDGWIRIFGEEPKFDIEEEIKKQTDKMLNNTKEEKK